MIRYSDRMDGPVAIGWGLTCETALVGPGLARELLSRNTHNRPEKGRSIDQYARSMDDDRWRPAQPILISECGTLLDGQNRLKAIVKSGATVPLIIIRGFPLATQRVLDDGAKRSTSDELHLANVPNASEVAAALRWCWRYDQHVRGRDSKAIPSRAELLAMYEREPTVREAVRVARGLRNAGVGFAMGVLAGVIHRCFTVDPEEAAAFFESLRSGAELEPRDPVYVLRSLMVRQMALPTERRWRTDETAALIIKAFNKWREGGPITYLKWTRGGVKREDFPKINPATDWEGEA